MRPAGYRPAGRSALVRHDRAFAEAVAGQGVPPLLAILAQVALD